MYFASFSDLLSMDGHGIYVWSVYGIASAIIAVLAISPLLKRRRFVREEAQRLRREGNTRHRPESLTTAQ